MSKMALPEVPKNDEWRLVIHRLSFLVGKSETHWKRVRDEGFITEGTYKAALMTACGVAEHLKDLYATDIRGYKNGVEVNFHHVEYKGK